MKLKHLIITQTILITTYLILFMFLIAKTSISTNSLQRAVLTVLGMSLITYLTKKENSLFFKSFSYSASVIFIFDYLFSMFNSLMHKQDLLFHNISMFSKTEGFIVMFCTFFIAWSFFRKSNYKRN